MASPSWLTNLLRRHTKSNPTISMNHGYIKPVRKATDYKLGRLGEEVLVPNGDWFNWIPLYEPQYGNGFDTNGCTIWGTQNALETLLKRITGKDFNFSERHVYIGTGTRPPGNDPFTIGEWIRKNGMVSETLLPFTQTFEEFIQPDPLPDSITKEARKFLDEYDIGQEYVFDDSMSFEERTKAITQALKYSPLGISVFAWVKDENGLYYRPSGAPDCHWCVLIGEDDTRYVVLDSYDQSIKHVRKDMDFSTVIRYSVKKKSVSIKLTLWQRFLNWLKYETDIFRYFYGSE